MTSEQAQREMTLKEWVEQLPPRHKARDEYAALLEATKYSNPQCKGDTMNEYQKAITRIIELEDTVAELLEELIVSIERGATLGYLCEDQLELYERITGKEYKGD